MSRGQTASAAGEKDGLSVNPVMFITSSTISPPGAPRNSSFKSARKTCSTTAATVAAPPAPPESGRYVGCIKQSSTATHGLARSIVQGAHLIVVLVAADLLTHPLRTRMSRAGRSENGSLLRRTRKALRRQQGKTGKMRVGRNSNSASSVSRRAMGQAAHPVTTPRGKARPRSRPLFDAHVHQARQQLACEYAWGCAAPEMAHAGCLIMRVNDPNASTRSRRWRVMIRW